MAFFVCRKNRPPPALHLTIEMEKNRVSIRRLMKLARVSEVFVLYRMNFASEWRQVEYLLDALKNASKPLEYREPGEVAVNIDIDDEYKELLRSTFPSIKEGVITIWKNRRKHED